MRLACLGAGVSLSLQSVAAPLDIQRLSVQSVRGEPLRAVAVIRTESSEQIAPACLSLGDAADLPFPDYPLLRNARIMLSQAGDAVEISTTEPVTSPGVAVVLRVQCPGEPLTARHFNLLIRQSRDPVQAHPAESAPPARGTRLTTLHDETVASIARSIYPGNAAARRQLEQAIVAANPELFPRGKPVPLKAGTRLVIPDLRDAKQIATAAAQVRARPEPQRPTAVRESPAARPPAGGETSAAAQTVEPRLPRKLKLRLARAELNLKRSEGIGEARREELRRLYRGEVVTVAAAGTEALELKIAQLRESQSVINSQLARLEQAVDSLRRSIAAMVSAAPAAPPPRPAPPPVAAPTAALRQQPPWLLWAAAAAAGTLLVALAFLLGRRTRSATGPADEHEARIDALLQQARAVAGPLLQPEAAPPQPVVRRPDVIAAPAQRRAVRPPPPPPAEEAALPTEAAQEGPPTAEVSPLPQLPDYMLEGEGKAPGGVDVELETGPEPAGEAEVKTGLKREMDLALDNSRSMFTDVDRFISLGRIQNAISLLEFQVHKDPNDRESWVKLMAVYRQEGMETEFQRTYAEFKRKFPGEA